MNTAVRHFSFLLPVLSLFAGCVPILSGDKNVTSSHPVLSLDVLISKDIAVSDPRIMKPVFGDGNAVEQMYRFFALNIGSALNDSSKFDTIFPSQAMNDSVLLPTKLPCRKNDTLMLYLPDPSVSKPFSTADVSLFIQDISFSGKALFNSYFLFGGRGSFNIKPLVCHARFALWDNKKARPISWGMIKAGRNMVMTKCSWVGLMNEFAGKVVDGSPYEAPPLYRPSSHIEIYEPKIKNCDLKQ